MTNETIHARLIAMESALRDVVAFEDRESLEAWQAEHPDESIYHEMVLRHLAAREVLEGASYEVARELAAAGLAAKLDGMRAQFMDAVAATPQDLTMDPGAPIEVTTFSDRDARTVEDRQYHENGTGTLEKMPESTEDVEPDEAALARLENARVLEAFRQQGTPGAEPGA